MVVQGRFDTGFWSLSEKSPCLLHLWSEGVLAQVVGPDGTLGY